MTQRLFSSIFSLLIVSACAQGPDLPGTLTPADRATPFPALVPLSQLQSRALRPTTITADSVAGFDARIATLRTRAAQLNRPVVDQGTRGRMQGAISRAALR